MSGLSSKASLRDCSASDFKVAPDEGIVDTPNRPVRTTGDTEGTMYDVIYIDSHGHETPVAQKMTDRQDAAEVAKQAAAERGVGRMVLPGSAKLPNCVCVVPVLPDAA